MGVPLDSHENSGKQRFSCDITGVKRRMRKENPSNIAHVFWGHMYVGCISFMAGETNRGHINLVPVSKRKLTYIFNFMLPIFFSHFLVDSFIA